MDLTEMRLVAILAAIGFLAIAAFQVALALGAPLGRAAWGGAHERLPGRLRIGSAIAVVVWVLAALIVLARGGLPVIGLPSIAIEWGPWVLVGLSAVGAMVNFASTSPWERFGWGPLALTLAALCLVLAIS
jgi:hypothetical protein